MVPHQPEVKDEAAGSRAARQKEGPRLVGDSQGPLGQGGTGLPNRTAGAFYSDSQLTGVFFFLTTH